MLKEALNVSIRIATKNDRDKIALIDVESMRSAYTGILPQSYLENLSLKEHQKAWAKRLKEKGSFVIVAESETGEIFGYAYGGHTRQQDPVYFGEVYRIYLHPSHQRQGVGRALMRAAAESLAAEGIHSLLIWVLSANPARKFYEALGGNVVRSIPTQVAGIEFEGIAYGWKDTAILRSDG